MSTGSRDERYRTLPERLEDGSATAPSTTDIQDIVCRSYRGASRHFAALHGESIGDCAKRVRLEKDAEYLKYS